MIESPKLIVYIICFYFLVIGLLQIVVGFYGLNYGLPQEVIQAADFSSTDLNLYLELAIVVGFLDAICAILLFSFNNWARYASIILGIFSSPGWVGVVLMLVILYFLWWYKPVINLFVKKTKVNEWGEEIPS
ncbi:Uncharacterised protein [uncultured archaeon]|nr:Uncharacterised protein [uncultured archaeon]